MKRESKITIVSIAGLLAVSLGLWGHQTFVVPQQEAEKYEVVYVASQDIPTNTTLEADMVSPVRVPQNATLPGAITSIDDATGQRVTGGILSGELVFEQRLSEDAWEEGQFFVRAEPDFPIDLEDGEHIRVLVQKDGDITELFTRKQVYATNRITNLLEGQSASGFYVLLTEQELINYYHAKHAGQIIMTKINTVATEDDIESGSGEPIILTDDSDDSEYVEDVQASNNRYTVQSDQTLEDIAYELQVSPDVLSELNDGIDSVDEGDVIVIP